MLIERTELIRTIRTNTGQALYDMTFEKPVLLVFLRQLGCVFCQEAVKDLRNLSKELKEKNVTLCFVHMGTPEQAEDYFAGYNLSGIPHISDPECKLYAGFGLVKGSFNQLFGLKVWLRTIETAVKSNANLFAKQIGDGFQMPGVFYLIDGQIASQFIHSKASDRPDYMDLISCSLG